MRAAFLVLALARALTAQAWTAHWIWTRQASPNQWVAFRKQFTIGSVPATAPTRIAADSKYWLYVNGALVVFEGGLKGGPTRDDVFYDEVDIAPYLRPGTNAIAVLVWHWGKDGYSYRSRGDAGAGFVLQSALGASVLASDGTWRARVHPGYVSDASGTQPNPRLSEFNVTYDARRGAGMDGWDASSFDDTAWESASDRGPAGVAPWNALGRRPIPQFRFTGIESYEKVTTVPFVFVRKVVGQLPTNLQVTPYIRVDAPAGAVIGIKTDYYTDGNEPNVRATYVTRAGVQDFESLGWMSGTAVEYTIPSNVRVLAVGYRESGYDTRFAGTFSSGDAFFDKLWQQAARTVYLNMRDSYMDCPTRERAQWWGDVVNEIRAAAYVFDSSSYALGRKAIADLVNWRRPRTNELFSPVPSAYFSAELPQQGLAAIWGAWRYYRLTGDSTWIAADYQVLADHVTRWSEVQDGLVEHRFGEWDWTDWGDAADSRTLDQAWYALAVRAVIDMARETGNSAEQQRWTARLQRLSAGFDALWDESQQAYHWPDHRGRADDRANALAVVAGLVPASRFPGIIKLLQTQMNASPYFEYHVLEALYLMHRPDAALARMRTRYAPQVTGPDAGPTLWEFWNPKDGTHNHGWNSGPLYVLSAYAAGVRPLEPGFTVYEVRPQLGSFPSVKADVPTARGLVSVAASGDAASGFRLTLRSPAGTRARVAVPWDGSGHIFVNGVEIYANGSAVAAVPGVSSAAVEADARVFELAPGEWTVVENKNGAPPPR